MEFRPCPSASVQFLRIHTAGVTSSKLVLPTKNMFEIKGWREIVQPFFHASEKSTENGGGRGHSHGGDLCETASDTMRLNNT